MSKKFKNGDKVRYSFHTDAGSHRHGKGIVLHRFVRAKGGEFWYEVKTPLGLLKHLAESELRPA